MMVKMVTILNENSQPETRQVPYGLAEAYGENAGMYKVQAICPEWGIVIREWKEPLADV